MAELRDGDERKVIRTEHDLDPPSHCIEPSCPACCCYIDPDGAPPSPYDIGGEG